MDSWSSFIYHSISTLHGRRNNCFLGPDVNISEWQQPEFITDNQPTQPTPQTQLRSSPEAALSQVSQDVLLPPLCLDTMLLFLGDGGWGTKNVAIAFFFLAWQVFSACHCSSSLALQWRGAPCYQSPCFIFCAEVCYLIFQHRAENNSFYGNEGN